MSRLPNKRLIIMAHADDPELACGGTIALWARHEPVHIIIVSSGEKGTWQKNAGLLNLPAKREAEAKRSARYLGVKKVIFLRHPDGEVTSIQTLKIELAAIIRSIKPRTIITHDPWRRQFHPDHRATGFAVIDAVMIARDRHFYPFLLEIGLNEHRPKELLFTPTDKPTVVKDITATFSKKIKAIQFHTSQLRQLPRWKKRIEQRALNEGFPAGFKYGEAFYKMDL
jgi:LmbE family N-acetylglucosaminyl deacetylase